MGLAFAPPLQAAETVRLLVLGNSLTAGFGLPQVDAFPEQLERALRADGINVIVINGGVSGDTSAGGLARLDWTLGSETNRSVDAVLVELGANDGLRGLDPQVTHKNLDAIVSKIKTHGLPVLLAGMKAPPNMGREYVDAFDSIYPKIAAEHGIPLYPFFLDGVATSSELNQADGIHPNAKGVAEIVRRILPSVRDLLRAMH
jgi:acyl-CoA thioesterase-1